MLIVAGLCVHCGRRSSAVFGHPPDTGAAIELCYECEGNEKYASFSMERMDDPSSEPEDVQNRYTMNDRVFSAFNRLRETDAIEGLVLYEVEPDGGAHISVRTHRSRGYTDYYILPGGELKWA